jgi:hypothetical protein
MTRGRGPGGHKPWVRDRKVALWGGVIAYTVGTLLVYDAYEGRGRVRPFATRFLPNL